MHLLRLTDTERRCSHIIIITYFKRVLYKNVPQIERQSKIEDNLPCAEHTGDANVRKAVDRKSINNAK